MCSAETAVPRIEACVAVHRRRCADNPFLGDACPVDKACNGRLAEVWHSVEGPFLEDTAFLEGIGIREYTSNGRPSHGERTRLTNRQDVGLQRLQDNLSTLVHLSTVVKIQTCLGRNPRVHDPWHLPPPSSGLPVAIRDSRRSCRL